MTVETVAVTCKPCCMCGKTSTVLVPKAGFDAWQAGAFVQVAFPDLSAAGRELLISGTCPACFDILFPPNEED